MLSMSKFLSLNLVVFTFIATTTYGTGDTLTLKEKAPFSVVTKPYTVSFSQKYGVPLAYLKAIVAGSAISGLAYLTKNIQTYKSNIALGLAIACLIFLRERSKLYQRLCSDPLDELLANPKKAFNRTQYIQQDFSEKYKKIRSEKEYEFKLKQLLQEFEHKSPIFLLDECTRENCGACMLSRQYKPKYRNCFENKTVSALIQQLKALPTPIHYASFACGGMFQDLVIITKTLAQKPNATLDLHFIDLKHAPYIKCCDLTNFTREIMPTHSINPHSVMNQFKIHAKEKWGLEQNAEQELIETCISTESQTKQFISYLKRTFPNAQLSLYVHESSNDYLAYLQKNKLSYADVITAVDIEDEMSLIKGSQRDYMGLLESTLTKNSTAMAIRLAKGAPYGSPGKVFLHTISRDPKEGTRELIGEESNQIEIYHNTETI